MSLDYLTITEANDLLNSKKVSAVELTKHYLSVISSRDSDLHAYISVIEERALDDAARSDKRRAEGNDMGPLDGIPGALKDIINTKGARTTASSRILEQFVPVSDAFVVERLNEAGMVLLGKTNLDEFAMGTTTEYSAFGPTKNPWDLSRVAGGSSGGSAAAVAGDECLFALGSDTGGSIRLPASWTGTVGLRPTYGRVSRNGIIAMASSLDQVGTLTRSVTDAAHVMNVIAKHDAGDSTSVPQDTPDYTKALRRDLKGMRIGMVKEFFGEGIDQHIAEAVHTAINQLQKLGAEIVEISLPLAEAALATYCILVPAEVSTNLERYDGIKYGHSAIGSSVVHDLLDVYMRSRAEGFGSEAKRRIMLGSYVLSAGYYDAYYAKAQKVRRLIQAEFERAFSMCDCLVGPVSPTNAFKIGENANDPLKTWLADVIAVPVNIAGLPGMSVPCGISDHLPIGMQIIANQFKEEHIFAVASAFEASTKWHLRHAYEEA